MNLKSVPLSKYHHTDIKIAKGMLQIMTYWYWWKFGMMLNLDVWFHSSRAHPADVNYRTINAVISGGHVQKNVVLHFKLN